MNLLFFYLTWWSCEKVKNMRYLCNPILKYKVMYASIFLLLLAYANMQQSNHDFTWVPAQVHTLNAAWKLIIDDFMAGLALKPGVLHRIQSSLSVWFIHPSCFIIKILFCSSLKL